jgi:2-dehydropantoate 2-reductase
MRVAVVGAGGIGGLYGGVLARAGHAVSFLARGAHLEAIRERGLEVRSAEFGTFEVRAAAASDPKELEPADLVLFAVKTYDLDDAAEAARQLLAPDASLLTFQNGLDAPDRVAAIVGQQHVMIGTTVLETTILEPGVIGHLTPWHSITVSAFDGPPTPRVEQVLDVLRAAGLNATAVEDGRRALWEKALFLSPAAAITAVCQSSFGPIRAVPETAALVETLLSEMADVSRACGYDLPEPVETARARLRTVPESTKASMARDFERGRRTELEALVGKVVQLAEAHHVSAPAFGVIYALLKLREQSK